MYCVQDYFVTNHKISEEHTKKIGHKKEHFYIGGGLFRFSDMSSEPKVKRFWSVTRLSATSRFEKFHLIQWPEADVGEKQKW